jgi:hypothetical protein
MTIIVLLSPGGSLDATSTRLATDVIAAECDPADWTVLAGMGRAVEVGEGCCGSARGSRGGADGLPAGAAPLEPQQGRGG